MANSKVIELPSDGPRSAPLPPILASIRQYAKKSLSSLLEGLFNNTDDTLFEMADRSMSNSDQQLYFESMRQIRLHRQQITRAFVVELYGCFDRCVRGEDQHASSEITPDFEDMTLVQNDELEVTVAIAGIVSKITSQNSLQIMQLTKRLDALVKKVEVTEQLNPLGPRALSHAFVAAIERLDVDIRIRIILLKLFERFVMERMAETYQTANRLLVEAGVLPDLKHTMRRKNIPAGSARGPAANGPHPVSHASGNSTASQSLSGPAWTGSSNSGGGGPATQSGFEQSGGQSFGGAGSVDSGTVTPFTGGGFNVIQRLLAGSRLSQRPASGSVVIDSNQIVDVLDRLQSQHETTSLETLPQLVDLHQVLNAKAVKITGDDNASITQNDEDVVNFVGMLFDYILNDKNLAIPMKALIARLQIPIVKLTILDKSFFERSDHPARRLLNDLSSAGIGWSSAAELKRDALYDKIESIVARVLNEFHDNPQIFEELIEELKAFVGRDSARVQMAERRLKDSELGKAKTVEAKRLVQSVINQKASGLRLHPTMGRFISDVWSRVLVYHCLTDGEQSGAWAEAVKMLDDLLWCIQPLNSLAEIEQRDRTRDELIEDLTERMKRINLSAEELAQHRKAVFSHMVEISDHDRAYLQDDVVPRPEDELELLQEITLAPHAEIEETLPDDAPEFLRDVEKLREGVWVEFRDGDSAPQRCKLATIMKSTNRYVFVNRRGMKTREMTRMALAAAIKSEELAVLDEAEVFDKALQAVIGNLRNMHRSPTPIS